MSERTTHKIIVEREREDITMIAKISIDTDSSIENDLLLKLKKATTEWFLTKEGKEEWDGSGGCFNIGDLQFHQRKPELIEILSSHGIYNLEIEVIFPNQKFGYWNCDTILATDEFKKEN
jgi:hypothetical protein